jgi:hypothetical protein
MRWIQRVDDFAADGLTIHFGGRSAPSLSLEARKRMRTDVKNPAMRTLDDGSVVPHRFEGMTWSDWME